MQVLSGDIGGTTTRLAIAEIQAGQATLSIERHYSSGTYTNLETIVGEFLASSGSPQPIASCFAVAGPVRGGRVHTTNLPWVVDALQLQRRFSVGPVSIINDLQAISEAIPHLLPDDLKPLQEGNGVEHGVKAVIAAGTGLGESFLSWDGTRYTSHASEGGHVDFAPRTEREAALLTYLRERHGHVSYERVLSGPGLENIYAFLHGDAEPAEAADQISERALAGGDAKAAMALEMFIELYGAQAGNLALTCLATGGLYIAGGIAPKILPALTADGRFLQAFHSKGRMQSLLASIPVSVVVHPAPGLLGAAFTAARSS